MLLKDLVKNLKEILDENPDTAVSFGYQDKTENWDSEALLLEKVVDSNSGTVKMITLYGVKV